jgi:hypothetical protein
MFRRSRTVIANIGSSGAAVLFVNETRAFWRSEVFHRGATMHKIAVAIFYVCAAISVGVTVAMMVLIGVAAA